MSVADEVREDECTPQLHDDDPKEGDTNEPIPWWRKYQRIKLVLLISVLLVLVFDMALAVMGAKLEASRSKK